MSVLQTYVLRSEPAPPEIPGRRLPPVGIQLRGVEIFPVEETLNAEISSASARRRASELSSGSSLQTETRVL